jgi:uncharacterized protein YndB with AHSA1/START domain
VSDRTVAHDTLVIDRTFDADAMRVFAAWASPEARQQWAVPDDDGNQVTLAQPGPAQRT